MECRQSQNLITGEGMVTHDIIVKVHHPRQDTLSSPQFHRRCVEPAWRKLKQTIEDFEAAGWIREWWDYLADDRCFVVRMRWEDSK